MNVDINFDMQESIKKTTTDFGQELTKRVRKFLNPDLLKLPDELPPFRPGFDHEIPLIDNAQVPPAKVYRMYIAKLAKLRNQLDIYLSQNLDTFFNF